jgi:hypothetical protein
VKKKVKVKNIILPYTHVLFVEASQIIFDRKLPLLCQQFEEVYNLSNIGPSPKRLKLGLDSSKDKVRALFGPHGNKNGYMYCYSDDKELIKYVKELWMIVH